ncbi:MAG: hypothetical protein ACRC68_04005 [Clostridium sp.]
MAKSVTLNFNNTSVALVADTDNLFSLKAIFEASGEGDNRSPRRFINDNRREYEGFVIDGVPSIKTTRGRYGDTRVNEQIVFAYARWCSVSFHNAVIEAFTAAANGDAVRAVKVAQSVVRVEGIGLRKAFCSQLGRHKATKGDYGSMTDIINIQVLGVSSSTKRRELGIKESAPLRDHLTDDQLLDLAAAEALAAMMMNKNANRDRGSMREAVYRAVELIKTV